MHDLQMKDKGCGALTANIYIIGIMITYITASWGEI